jgi:hypothetical protein
MQILITLLYITGALILLLLLLVSFILLVPFRYRLKGGYDTRPWFRFRIRCSPAFIFAGKWDEAENKDLQARIILFGIPIKVDPQKMGKSDKEEKKKDISNDNKKKGKAAIISILDKEFRRRGLALISDLLGILKPEQLSIKGKIGFTEPHYTGWLAAFLNSIYYSCHPAFIDLEPVFDDECFTIESKLSGRIPLGLILIKVGWFFFISWIKNISVSSGGEALSPAATLE